MHINIYIWAVGSIMFIATKLTVSEYITNLVHECQMDTEMKPNIVVNRMANFGNKGHVVKFFKAQ